MVIDTMLCLRGVTEEALSLRCVIYLANTETMDRV